MLLLLVGVVLGFLVGALGLNAVEQTRHADRDAEYRRMLRYVVARGYLDWRG